MKDLKFRLFLFIASAVLLGLAISHNNIGDYSDLLFKTFLIGFSIISLPVSIKELIHEPIGIKIYTFIVALTITLKTAIDVLVFHNY